MCCKLSGKGGGRVVVLNSGWVTHVCGSKLNEGVKRTRENKE